MNPHATPFTPTDEKQQHPKTLHADDMDVIRQRRLQKFLLRCATTGTEVVLDPTRQDKATTDTMLEVKDECDARGIPVEDRPLMLQSPLPPTPKTYTRKCIWRVGYIPPYQDYDLTEEEEKYFYGFDYVFGNMMCC